MTDTWTLDELIDTDRYPIHRQTDPAYRAAVDGARRGLRAQGCAVVADLVRPKALRLFGREIAARKSTTHFSTELINPYFHTSPDDRYPPEHPVNTFLERSSGFIPGDSWGSDTAIRTLFEHPALCRFLADCLELPELHPYADPLAGLTSNILDPGQLFTWHFDTNEFAVTVLVEEADEGGLFEFVANIRSTDDEGFEAIERLLGGDRTGVTTLDLQPGDLQIFRGRYSLHQVSRVASDSRPRHAAILAYTEQPGVIGRVERTRQLFGRVLPEHLAAEVMRVRSDSLLD